MDMSAYRLLPGEKPLDRIPSDGGFCAIFRTIACVGDSLSSGEFESSDAEGHAGYHDMFEYSWGQFIARMCGSKCYNFSRGGMTAIEYMESFAEANDFWNPDKAAEAYIIAMGCNDLFGRKQKVGRVEETAPDYKPDGEPTFAYWFGRMFNKLRSIQPKARFFLMTMPVCPEDDEEHARLKTEHAELMRKIAWCNEYTYVIDLHEYGPAYDKQFHDEFYLGGHLNPMGYLLTAKMTAAYIDYIIRSKPEDFAQIGFIGKPFHNMGAKW